MARRSAGPRRRSSARSTPAGTRATTRTGRTASSNTAAAPWLFKGTGLHDGSSVGNYGIEVDEPNSASPPHTHVLAEIPNELGPGKPAEMTIYTRGRSTVFDAGAINFGASAHWPALSRFFSNLWSHLSGETQR